jgi:hypothetical protein
MFYVIKQLYPSISISLTSKQNSLDYREIIMNLDVTNNGLADLKNYQLIELKLNRTIFSDISVKIAN